MAARVRIISVLCSSGCLSLCMQYLCCRYIYTSLTYCICIKGYCWSLHMISNPSMLHSTYSPPRPVQYYSLFSLFRYPLETWYRPSNQVDGKYIVNKGLYTPWCIQKATLLISLKVSARFLFILFKIPFGMLMNLCRIWYSKHIRALLAYKRITWGSRTINNIIYSRQLCIYHRK